MRSSQLAMPLLATLAVAGCSSSSLTSGGAASILQSQYELVVQHVLPSVVQITTSNSTGSGVVYDNKGDVVTNQHVIGTNTTVKVVDSVGGHTLTAKVIGAFAPDDLAVIRVQSDAGTLEPATFGDSSHAQVGQIVLAMGNPLGLNDSVTQGIISATGRTVGGGEPNGGKALITAAIQTSAAINPGNSGGALVNLADQVIGIPTLAATLPGETGGLAPGIGFAIPSNTVKNIANQLIKSGRVTNSDRATLGITAQTIASDAGKPAGVAVLAVNSGGTAANAGLRAGDIIVGINDQRVTSVQELESTLATLQPGKTVRIMYTRGSSKVHEGSAKLGSLAS
jgi:S1-C subfamily serine protease